MATINLGNIKFNWKGTYAGGTAYVVDDVVSYSGSSYICKLASTGNLPTNGTYWDVMSQAGTNGTDVGTTITTQGDILYRDGSGLQRLAKPASNKMLQNTSGGVLSWESVSSDMVKLGEVAVSGSVANVAFENLCNSTYSMYKMYASHVRHSASCPTNVIFGYGSTPTYITSADYIFMGAAHYTDMGSTNDFTWCDKNQNQTKLQLPFDNSNHKTQGFQFEILFTGFDPSLATDPQLTYTKGGSSSSWFHQGIGGGWLNNATARSNQITSIKLEPNSGTFDVGKFVLYGIK